MDAPHACISLCHGMARSELSFAWANGPRGSGFPSAGALRKPRAPKDQAFYVIARVNGHQGRLMGGADPRTRRLSPVERRLVLPTRPSGTRRRFPEFFDRI